MFTQLVAIGGSALVWLMRRGDIRFLTDDPKQDILAEWERTKACWRCGDISGVGVPDADIVPWCDRLNELPGICTIQSCAGHSDGNAVQSAHLWVWMSREVAERFDRKAFLLLRNRDALDWISRHYLHGGKEIASITFFGNERGNLEKSIRSIYGFMCGKADE